MAWINHLHTLPKIFNVINVFYNLPYLIQPPVISSFIPYSLINWQGIATYSNLCGTKMFIWWEYPQNISLALNIFIMSVKDNTNPSKD